MTKYTETAPTIFSQVEVETISLTAKEGATPSLAVQEMTHTMLMRAISSLRGQAKAMTSFTLALIMY